MAAQVSWHNQVSSVDDIISSGRDQLETGSLHRTITDQRNVNTEFSHYQIFLVSGALNIFFCKLRLLFCYIEILNQIYVNLILMFFFC